MNFEMTTELQPYYTQYELMTLELHCKATRGEEMTFGYPGSPDEVELVAVYDEDGDDITQQLTGIEFNDLADEAYEYYLENY